MDEEKEQMRETYKDKLPKYGCIWEIIDNRWNNQLHHPIHAAGYFLNPKYHYKAQLGDLQDGEVRARLIDCLERMVPSHADQLEIHRKLTLFSMATGTFGKNLAKMARDVDQPDWIAINPQAPCLRDYIMEVWVLEPKRTESESYRPEIHLRRENKEDWEVILATPV
eukprot:PITA_08369